VEHDRRYCEIAIVDVSNHRSTIGVIFDVDLTESDSGAGHPLGFEGKIPKAAVPLLRPMLAILAGSGSNLLNIVDDSPEADITPMAESGVPAFGLLQDGRDYFKYHHTSADTLDKIDPQALRENAAAMAVLGYAVADLPARLPR